MAIKTDIRGMIWRYPESFVVGREKIREFAASIKAEDPAHYDEAAAAELGYDSLVAPLTFVAILAKLVQADFFRNVDTGYTTMQMVQVDQGFTFHKPIKAGDTLYCDVYVDSFRRAHGTDIVVNKNIITNDRGEVVQEAYTTLAGRSADEDGQGGFSDGAS